MKLLVISQNTDVTQFGSVAKLLLVQNQLKVIDAGFQELKLATPDWVTDTMSEVSHEITTRSKGELLRMLKAAKARRSALRTADEKRNDLDADIAELEAKLK
jgi:hypothetical protein